MKPARTRKTFIGYASRGLCCGGNGRDSALVVRMRRLDHADVRQEVVALAEKGFRRVSRRDGRHVRRRRKRGRRRETTTNSRRKTIYRALEIDTSSFATFAGRLLQATRLYTRHVRTTRFSARRQHAFTRHSAASAAAQAGPGSGSSLPLSGRRRVTTPRALEVESRKSEPLASGGGRARATEHAPWSCLPGAGSAYRHADTPSS